MAQSMSEGSHEERIPEISSRHCLAVLLYTHSPLVGLRQGSAGATVVQSFSENVLEPRGNKEHGRLVTNSGISGRGLVRNSNRSDVVS